MTRWRWINIWIAWMAVGLASGTAQVAGPAHPGWMIRVTSVQGRPVVISEGKKPEEVGVGASLSEGALIRTGTDCRVRLEFANGATVEMEEGSELKIRQFSVDAVEAVVEDGNRDAEPSTSRTKLWLDRGEILVTVKKLDSAKGSLFVVETAVGAAGIRGTSFRLRLQPASEAAMDFSVSVLTGMVSVFLRNGVSTNVVPERPFSARVALPL